MQTEQLRQLVLKTLEDMKANNIIELNVEQLSSFTDTMIICTGNSTRHVKSIASNLVEQAKHRGVPPIGVEGEDEAKWILVDLGDVIAHVMEPETRDYYQLEKFWGYQEVCH